MIKGKDIVIVNGSGTAVIGAAKSCDIEIGTDLQEKANPEQGGWKMYDPKKSGWTITIAGLLTEVSDLSIISGSSVSLFVAVEGDASLKLSGTALVANQRITATKGNLAVRNVKLQGTGALTEVTPSEE